MKTETSRALSVAHGSAVVCVRVESDGLPPCGDCGKLLKDDWHGLAACFCKWGGREPTIDEIEAAADAADDSE